MSDKADKQLGRGVVFDKGRRDLAPAIRCGGENMTLSALPLSFQVVSDSDMLGTGVTGFGSPCSASDQIQTSRKLLFFLDPGNTVPVGRER